MHVLHSDSSLLVPSHGGKWYQPASHALQPTHSTSSANARPPHDPRMNSLLAHLSLHAAHVTFCVAFGGATMCWPAEHEPACGRHHDAFVAWYSALNVPFGQGTLPFQSAQ